MTTLTIRTCHVRSTVPNTRFYLILITTLLERFCNDRSATDKVLGTLGMVENSAGRGMKKINRQIT